MKYFIISTCIITYIILANIGIYQIVQWFGTRDAYFLYVPEIVLCIVSIIYLIIELIDKDKNKK